MKRTPGGRARALLPGVLLVLALNAASPLLPFRAQEGDLPAALDRAASLRRRGYGPEALEALRRIWAATPAGPDKTAALAYGRMALLSGEADAALDPLREAADSRGPLAPYGRLLLAEALIETGRPAEAEKPLWNLTASASPRLRRKALTLLARAQEAQGKLTPRLETLSRLEEESRGTARDRVRWERARALLQLERYREAGRICLDLYGRPSCPYGREAGLILRDLEKRGLFRPPPRSRSETLELCRRFLRAGRREDARDLLSTLPAAAFEGEAGDAASLLRVEVLYALRRNGEAVRAADALLAARGSTEAALRASLKAVWALLREGHHDEVVRRCRLLLDLPAKGREGLHLEARNAWAASAYAAGRFEEAAERWAGVEGLGPSPSLVIPARYRRAWSLQQAGRSPEALELFRSLARDPSAASFEAVALWGAARAARTLEDREAEREALLRLASHGDPYWRAAAVRRLLEIGIAPAPPPPLSFPEAWSGGASGPAAALARSLDRAGLEAEAAEAFAPLYRREGGRPEVACTYALLCGRAGFRAAAAEALKRASPEAHPMAVLPAEALEALYPLPRAGEIRRLAAAEGVAPALVLAVMLQESGFDGDALSPAGARGLMQLMPETAARLLREGEAPPDLYDPAVNTALGVRYLALLLKRFPTAGAVAAYNAGEDVVSRWLSAWKPSCEEDFVAMIPYAETRAYTARVLSYARDYGRMLADKGGKGPG